jgi:hypothetical protein
MDRERLKGNLDLLLLSVLSAGPAHGYAMIAALRERSGGLLAGFFPVVAASFFGVMAIPLTALNVSGMAGISVVILACLVLAVGYAVRMGQALLRQC